MERNIHWFCGNSRLFPYHIDIFNVVCSDAHRNESKQVSASHLAKREHGRLSRKINKKSSGAEINTCESCIKIDLPDTIDSTV